VQITGTPAWAQEWLECSCRVDQVRIKGMSLRVRAAPEQEESPAGASPSSFCTTAFTREWVLGSEPRRE